MSIMSVPSTPQPPRNPQHRRAGEERQLRRTYSPPSGRKDVDQAERTNVLRAFTWSLPGALLGGLAVVAGGSPLLGFAIWAATFAIPLIASSLGGRAAGNLYNPSGRSTPRKREYSHAESLVARGRYQDAIDSFETAIAEDGSDPTPYLRIARIHRDKLAQHEDAVRWLERALTQSSMHAGLERLAVGELVELCAGKMAEPGRAAPMLARMAAERAGTPEGDWAAEQLARVKALMAEDGGAGSRG